MRRSAHALEALLVTVHAEVPDTAATLRLSGMELADCIQEVGSLRWVNSDREGRTPGRAACLYAIAAAT